MQSILALDVSGKVTGWAFGLPTEKPISGFEPWKREGDTEDEVFRRGMIWLFRQMDFLKPSIVAIEAPIKASGGGFTNAASQSMLLGLQGALRAVVKSKIPGRAQLVASSTARKTFIGKGGNFGCDPKILVQAEVIRRGWLPQEDAQPDRCDALCLWGHMAAEQNPDLDYRKAIKARPALMEA